MGFAWGATAGRRGCGRGVPRNPAEAEAHRAGGSAGGEAWRRGESDAAQPAAEVGRDRARSHLARGGGRCQRGPGGLGPGAARGCRCRFDTRGGVDKLPFILFFETRHDAWATGEGAADFTGGAADSTRGRLCAWAMAAAVRVRDFRRATTGSVEEFTKSERHGDGWKHRRTSGLAWPLRTGPPLAGPHEDEALLTPHKLNAQESRRR